MGIFQDKIKSVSERVYQGATMLKKNDHKGHKKHSLDNIKKLMADFFLTQTVDPCSLLVKNCDS